MPPCEIVIIMTTQTSTSHYNDLRQWVGPEACLKIYLGGGDLLPLPGIVPRITQPVTYPLPRTGLLFTVLKEYWVT
jgi:hypothetical protein